MRNYLAFKMMKTFWLRNMNGIFGSNIFTLGGRRAIITPVISLGFRWLLEYLYIRLISPR
ncbi:hypothetical protein K450DRAFT_252399 [Umbelopsis ramanniana AG]|uniref:Uncharacterized protein n=1 Tax=Umbelopsis ramanniana AG TaxID=1314678 RepID=A0AAD5E5V5_UMBRA|nr:uncharacterized protein K450DRAFT_252399 [Umbelopsis ramanniana AG]KAI8577432.1 hypothetical protein K450DRAFT_252399 [Umbelopsis ramanniana AG]